MFNRNTSLLAGAMTPEQLQAALAKTQQAYIDLAAGVRGVSFRIRRVMEPVPSISSHPHWLI